MFEQLGRHLVPGPVLWTMLAAPVVDGAATGERAGRRRRGRRPWTAGRCVVEHAAEIDVLLVARTTTASCAARRAEPGAADALDAARPAHPGRPVRRPARRRRRWAAPRRRPSCGCSGTVLSAALLVGVASRALDVARAYALEREQFGVPIGSFQAVKHLLADMYVRDAPRPERHLRRRGRAATIPAATTRAARPPPRSCSPARPRIDNAGTAVQVLGGMGFTWDMLPNYLLKRAWVLEHAFGTADDHAAAPRARRSRRRSRVTPQRRWRRDRGRRRRAAHRSTGPTRRTRSTRRRSGPIVEALEAAATDDSLRAVLLASTGRRLLLGRRLGGEQRRRGDASSPRHRQPPAPHRRCRPPADRTLPRSEVQLPVVCAVRGWAAGPRAASSPSPPTSRSPPRTAASGSRSPSAASARQRRHLAAAPPRRRRPGQGAAPARAGRSAGARPRRGG